MNEIEIMVESWSFLDVLVYSALGVVTVALCVPRLERWFR